MRACAVVYVCIHMHTRTHALRDTRNHAHTYIHDFIHVQNVGHVCVHMVACVTQCVRVCVRACVRAMAIQVKYVTLHEIRDSGVAQHFSWGRNNIREVIIITSLITSQ